jgi:hypothetical protein
MAHASTTSKEASSSRNSSSADTSPVLQNRTANRPGRSRTSCPNPIRRDDRRRHVRSRAGSRSSSRDHLSHRAAAAPRRSKIQSVQRRASARSSLSSWATGCSRGGSRCCSNVSADAVWSHHSPFLVWIVSLLSSFTGGRPFRLSQDAQDGQAPRLPGRRPPSDRLPLRQADQGRADGGED